MSTLVKLGNAAPMNHVRVTHPETGDEIGVRQVPHPYLKQSVTEVVMQDDFADDEHVDRALSTDNDRELLNISKALTGKAKKYAIGIQHLEQLWSVHSGAGKPDYVDSSDPDFAKAVGSYFNIHVGTPTALLTYAGRDAIHQQHLSGSQPAAFTQMAISANTTAESTASTSLTGEIATAGGGLIRGSATFAHTTGTNTSTVTKTFTANGSDVLPVTLAKIGTFNAASSGTIANEKLLGSTSTLTTSGDNVTVTLTDTIG